MRTFWHLTCTCATWSSERVRDSFSNTQGNRNENARHLHCCSAIHHMCWCGRCARPATHTTFVVTSTCLTSDTRFGQLCTVTANPLARAKGTQSPPAHTEHGPRRRITATPVLITSASAQTCATRTGLFSRRHIPAAEHLPRCEMTSTTVVGTYKGAKVRLAQPEITDGSVEVTFFIESDGPGDTSPSGFLTDIVPTLTLGERVLKVRELNGVTVNATSSPWWVLWRFVDDTPDRSGSLHFTGLDQDKTVPVTLPSA